ncbi:haloalkane dehalogenase [Shimia sp. NS0008-38b]|uniref:haloalkane dehalogenase n=1 Tax=Shimia sp. NS0008-38b TaxID=3127653 RepID=UPI003106A424
MKRREFIATTGLALTALGVPAQLWAKGDADFPFEMKTQDILGHKMAYVDEGTGDPIVFFHGNPTSSYLWRNVIPHVTDTHRAIAADMIGMGNSDKPDLAYTYDDHAAHLHGLLDALDLQNVTLVLHDWGGALGFDWAMKNPDKVKAIAYMETIAPPVLPFESYDVMGPLGEIFKAWRTTGVGEKMILEDNMFINEMLGKQGVATPLSDEVLAHYNSYYPDAASRAPILEWPRQVPIGGVPERTTKLTLEIVDYLTTSEIPKLTFHVTPGAIAPPEAIAWMKANVPNLETLHLGPGAHFIQEDYPHEIGRGLAEWLQRV